MSVSPNGGTLQDFAGLHNQSMGLCGDCGVPVADEAGFFEEGPQDRDFYVSCVCAW